MHVGRRAKFKLVLRARVQFLTKTAISEVNTAAALAIKKENPAAGRHAGFYKRGRIGQTARLNYLASMYFATWALARLAALRCTTPDLMALSIAEA